jgi:hypothetical protein
MRPFFGRRKIVRITAPNRKPIRYYNTTTPQETPPDP